jgi:hypothetical protein
MIPIPNALSFFTGCYEADWKALLQTNRLQHMIE